MDSSMISAQIATHSSQMKTPSGPAISFETCFSVLLQNEHLRGGCILVLSAISYLL